MSVSRELAAPARIFLLGIGHGSLPEPPWPSPCGLSPGPDLTAPNLNLQFWKTSCSRSSRSALCLPENGRGGHVRGREGFCPALPSYLDALQPWPLALTSIFPRRYLGRLLMSPWHRSNFTLPFKNCWSHAG